MTEDRKHLLNSEAVTAQAIFLARLVDEPTLAVIQSERGWGKLVHFDHYTSAELLTYYTFRRRVVMNVQRSLSDEQWERVVREAGKIRKESVSWKARALALHEVDHLIDLRLKLQAKK
jgi:hypothetical protein